MKYEQYNVVMSLTDEVQKHHDKASLELIAQTFLDNFLPDLLKDKEIIQEGRVKTPPIRVGEGPLVVRAWIGNDRVTVRFVHDRNPIRQA